MKNSSDAPKTLNKDLSIKKKKKKVHVLQRRRNALFAKKKEGVTSEEEGKEVATQNKRTTQKVNYCRLNEFQENGKAK